MKCTCGSGAKEEIERLEGDKQELKHSFNISHLEERMGLLRRIEELEQGLKQIYMWSHRERLISSQIEKLLPK